MITRERCPSAVTGSSPQSNRSRQIPLSGCTNCSSAGKARRFFTCASGSEPVIFATHQPRDLGSQQVRDDGSIPVLAIESDEGLTSGQAQLRLIRRDHLQPSRASPLDSQHCPHSQTLPTTDGYGPVTASYECEPPLHACAPCSQVHRPVANVAVEEVDQDSGAEHAVVRPVSCRQDSKTTHRCPCRSHKPPTPSTDPGRASASCKNTLRSASTLA